jgi:hypothetical protein
MPGVMSTPANAFVAVCANANLQLPTNKQRQIKFLTDAGITIAASSPAQDVRERAATLVWARHAVANTINPSTWSRVLGPAPLAALCQLYPIQPLKLGADPAETDLHRLARVVALYLPDIALDVAAPFSSQTRPCLRFSPPLPGRASTFNALPAPRPCRPALLPLPRPPRPTRQPPRPIRRPRLLRRP